VVKPTSGKYYIDMNAARMNSLSRSPLMPIFASAEAYGSLSNLKGHDIITDRNGLRKLYRWARGTGNGQSFDFRIDVQLAGNTCLFTRREPKNVSRSSPGNLVYGFSYEKAATTVAGDSKGCHGHHRIISYVSNVFTFYRV
jgi:hypothetical protein